jgi:hypothetical protein
MVVNTHSLEIRRALLLEAALATLWVVMAIVREGVTFHLAPLIVVAAPTLAARTDQEVKPGVTRRLALVGLAGALGVTLLLTVLGRLEGPSLLPFGGAATEAVVFSAVGAVGARLSGMVPAKSYRPAG